MSELQDLTNENSQRARKIVSGQEKDDFLEWVNRAQLSTEDARWIIALLKRKYREGQCEVCTAISRY